MLAIGELQTSMGPDQSVSARASVINKNAAEPNLLGAWESWHWKPGTTGPNYSEKETKFRGWLVSAPEPKTATTLEMASSELKDPVWLVNPDTVGAPTGSNEVGPRLRADRVPMQISETRFGAFAWGVMDESQKAPIQLEDIKPATDGERIARRTAPGRARPEEILATLAPDKLGDPDKIVSLDSAVVAVGKEEGKKILSYQGDVTPYSVGLLSNVIDGGLKTDLTTVFESSSVSPNVNDTPTLYYTANDGAPRWDYLKNHYQLHRRVISSAAGTPMVKLNAGDLAIQANGLRPSPNVERLLPVIAKLQIMFSVVTHLNHLGDRIDFYNTRGNPAGYQNYGCPHLAYDPVITLYNPYDVSIDLTKIRIRVWDPPVLFGFKKNNIWLRPEFASGEFHGLARFQIANEGNKSARRYFTMYLRDVKTAGASPASSSKNITLQPGEVRVFSPWVEQNWTWGLETAGGYTVRCFFDWNAGNDFGNKDGRTGNNFGIESVPGWDPRAGLQTDHLSYGGGGRPDNTRYSFEPENSIGDGGWLAIKTGTAPKYADGDTFGVEARPGRAVADTNKPDFQVDVLAGTKFSSMDTTTDDMLRTYRFRLTNPTNEISATPAKPTITRNFISGQILQTPGDKSAGGKSPFAILSMTAKTTKTNLDVSMPWLHNHPVVEGAEQTSSRIGNALDSYDLRFEETSDFNANPGGIEFEAGTNRGFYGATPYSQGGVSNVPMFRVPVTPAASLGDLVSANLVSSSHLPRVTHAFGNSRAHPLIPSGSVNRKSPTDPTGVTIRTSYEMLDHSYLINDALWDRTYFSTVANFANVLIPGGSRKTLLTDFMKGDRKLLNPRFVPLLQGQGSIDQQAEELDALDEITLSRRLASTLGIQGPFNVNSDSVGAWKAMLTSLRDADLRGWSMTNLAPGDKTGFPRFGLPIAGDVEEGKNAGIDLQGQIRWAGFRALDDEQIDLLATQIVAQIRARGTEDNAPSLNLAEFVNRRLGNSSALHSLAGLLQTAIDESGINNEFHKLDSKDLASTPITNPASLTGIANADARKGKSAEGAPAMLTQGDLLMALAPVITVRGDTFRVRAYGESRTKDGKVEAKAWCEAIVQRLPEYLDASEKPELKFAALNEEANKVFGRRFVISSFRWLSPEEV